MQLQDTEEKRLDGNVSLVNIHTDRSRSCDVNATIFISMRQLEKSLERLPAKNNKNWIEGRTEAM